MPVVWRDPPFDRDGIFFRGNLHCHSSRSDGALDPEHVVSAYKRLGYDFICLSDHFEADYGWQLTDTSSWRDESFTTLIGAELSRPGPVRPGKWWLGAVGLPLDFPAPDSREKGPELASRARAAGAFLVLLHPGFNATQTRDLEGMDVIDAVEIYNDGVQRGNDRGDGWYLAVDLLDRGWEISCTAADDAHFDLGGYDAIGGAWVEVRSPVLEPAALLAALKGGAFYATTGPKIQDVRVIDRAVEVHCTPAEVVTVTGPGCLVRSVAQRRWDGRLNAPGPANDWATIAERQPEGITRCRLSLESPGAAADWGVWGPGDWWRVTISDSAGKRAWTNPSRLPA